MSRRTQIGSALDAILKPEERSPSPPARHARQMTAALNVQIDADLLDQLRDLVVYESGPPRHLTLRALVEQALRERLERELEAARQAGRIASDAAFPRRGAELRVGRPIRSAPPAESDDRDR